MNDYKLPLCLPDETLCMFTMDRPLLTIALRREVEAYGQACAEAARAPLLARIAELESALEWQAETTKALLAYQDEAVKGRARIAELESERNIAVRMLAEWCVAVDQGGASWDEWDEHYKEAAYRPGPLRTLIDTAIYKVKMESGDA